ncbi:MAG: HEAT repeat domain-containing protein [Synechococcaceae cyanobacterium]|nr:HEAT repeat domain-containing protein [Synechococcaceae cyanobacterium]
MNPSFLAAIAASVLAVLWLAGRRRAPFAMTTDTRAVAALNRAQIERMHREERPPADAASPGAPSAAPTGSPRSGGGRGTPLPLPTTARERLQFRTRLEALYRRGGDHRREAVAAARRWRHPDGLPLLRRALHDPDPAVMREAARAMEAFRGRPGTRPEQRTAGARGPAAQAEPLPRNVARMR